MSTPTPLRGAAPLSHAQERLWLVDRASPGSPTYNVPLLLRWSGPVDVPALRRALAAVVTRHEALRTTYALRDGRPVQQVGAPYEVEIAVDAAESVEAARRRAGDRALEPFDLATGPLLRCAVWTGPYAGDVVLLTVAHVAVDGWSLVPLFRDLTRAYRGESLPGPDSRYAEFAATDRAAVAALGAQVADRVDTLVAVPGPLRLGGARPVRPAPEGSRPGRQAGAAIPAGTWTGVGELARTVRATPFVVLLAAYAEVLRRWSGRSEFAVGTVTANRPPELADVVGFFVNTVPLRCQVEPGQTFRELCRATRTEAFRSLTHQRIPYDRLVAAAAARRGHAALVDVGFALQNMPAPEPGAPWGPYTVLPTGTAKFDLLLVVDETPDGATATVEFDTDLYPGDVGERFAADWAALLAAAVAEPDRRLDGLPVPYGPTAAPGPVVLAARPIGPAPDLGRATALFASALSEVEGHSPGELGPDADFFALGGNSLLAVTMLAEARWRHGVAVRPGDFLADPTAAGLARLLATDPAADEPPGGPPDDAADHPATSVQRRLWMLDRIPELRAAYLVPAVVELDGADPDRLRAATDEVLARHPALRSAFRLDRRSRAVVFRTDGPPARTAVTDARGWTDGAVAEHVAELCWTPFDLAAGPPVRAAVVLLSGRCLLVLVASHLVVDGWSQQELLDQVGAAYRGDPLPEPVHPARLPEPVTGGVEAVAAALAGAPTDVQLLHDRPRGDVQSIAGGTVRASLGPDLAGRLRRTAAGGGCSTFLAVAALFAVTLSRRTGQQDLVLVFPWAGRAGPAAAHAVGMFVNTVPLRVDLRGGPTWREVLDRVRAAGAVSYRYADLPFDAVAAAVHPDRDLSRPPVTPVYVAAADRPATPPQVGVPARFRPLDPLAVKHELELVATERDADLDLALSYQLDLFDPTTAGGLLTDLLSAATDLAANPDGRAYEGDVR